MENGLHGDPHRFARKIDGQEVDVSCWFAPDVGTLQETARKHYLACQDAVTMYLDGASEGLIRQR